MGYDGFLGYIDENDPIPNDDKACIDSFLVLPKEAQNIYFSMYDNNMDYIEKTDEFGKIIPYKMEDWVKVALKHIKGFDKEDCTNYALRKSIDNINSFKITKEENKEKEYSYILELTYYNEHNEVMEKCEMLDDILSFKSPDYTLSFENSGDRYILNINSKNTIMPMVKNTSRYYVGIKTKFKIDNRRFAGKLSFMNEVERIGVLVFAYSDETNMRLWHSDKPIRVDTEENKKESAKRTFDKLLNKGGIVTFDGRTVNIDCGEGYQKLTIPLDNSINTDDHISWDEFFMGVAVLASKRSKDPSTKVGACIVKDNHIISTGYNGMPNTIDDLDNDKIYPWNRDGEKQSETKYFYVVHAEENAILSSPIPVRGGILYCTLSPCNECAKAIIQSGIKEVVYINTRDEDMFKIAIIMMKNAGIIVRKYGD